MKISVFCNPKYVTQSWILGLGLKVAYCCQVLIHTHMQYREDSIVQDQSAKSV